MEVNYDSLAAASSSSEELQGILRDLQLDIYQPQYHSYIRNLHLNPVEDLNSLRVPNANFTNIVAFRKSASGGPGRVSRLIGGRF